MAIALLPTPTGYGVLDEDPRLRLWIHDHHNPQWKHKPPRFPKTSRPRRLSAAQFAALAEEHGLVMWQVDMGEHEPESLEDFMARKHDPNYKPWKPAAPRKLAPMSAGDRVAEEKRVAEYVGSR